MIEDPDIFRAAQLMIDRHGDEASWRAALRVSDLGGRSLRLRHLAPDCDCDRGVAAWPEGGAELA